MKEQYNFCVLVLGFYYFVFCSVLCSAEQNTTVLEHVFCVLSSLVRNGCSNIEIAILIIIAILLGLKFSDLKLGNK